jgi:hypothetical protein
LNAAGKLVELEYASIVDGKVRSQLRSAGDLEVKVSWRVAGRAGLSHGLRGARRAGSGRQARTVRLGKHQLLTLAAIDCCPIRPS